MSAPHKLLFVCESANLSNAVFDAFSSLSRGRIQVMLVSELGKAADFARGGGYDPILVDVDSSMVEGMHVVHSIAQAMPALKVIVMSREMDASRRQQFLRQGARLIVNSPRSIEDMEALLLQVAAVLQVPKTPEPTAIAEPPAPLAPPPERPRDRGNEILFADEKKPTPGLDQKRSHVTAPKMSPAVEPRRSPPDHLMPLRSTDAAPVEKSTALFRRLEQEKAPQTPRGFTPLRASGPPSEPPKPVALPVQRAPQPTARVRLPEPEAAPTPPVAPAPPPPVAPRPPIVTPLVVKPVQRITAVAPSQPLDARPASPAPAAVPMAAAAPAPVVPPVAPAAPAPAPKPGPAPIGGDANQKPGFRFTQLVKRIKPLEMPAKPPVEPER